jgi:hypothetical protein
MIDRAIALFGIALSLVIGLWAFAPEGWPKMPPWATLSGIGIGILLFGVGVGLIVGDLRGGGVVAPLRPELRLMIQGANVFIPDLQPTWTGIGVDARIWNTGKPSIVTGWSMTIIPNGKPPIVAQLTQMPNVLTAHGPFNSSRLLAENSLELKTKDTPVETMPVSGALLFYVALLKDIVQASDTKWEIVANDIYEKETRVSHLVGDWLQR